MRCCANPDVRLSYAGSLSHTLVFPSMLQLWKLMCVCNLCVLLRVRVRLLVRLHVRVRLHTKKNKVCTLHSLPPRIHCEQQRAGSRHL